MLVLAHTMSARLIVGLTTIPLLAGWAPAGAWDSSAPPVKTAAAESPRPAVANGALEAQETEQAPNSKLAATVLGEEVRTSDVGEMQEVVLTRLFDRYAEEQGITVTNAEIDAYVDRLRRGMRAEGLTAEDNLTPEEAAEVEQMRRNMARSMIRQWKRNRALYRQYGGRIIYQQFGPEPLDAYRHYLEVRQAAGDFTIHEKAFENVFWRYFTDDTMHNFFQPGSEEETQVFVTPPWEPKAGGK